VVDDNDKGMEHVAVLPLQAQEFYGNDKEEDFEYGPSGPNKRFPLDFHEWETMPSLRSMTFSQHYVSSIVSSENPNSMCEFEPYCLGEATRFYSHLGYFIVPNARVIWQW
jgi:hypothetical protein